MIALTNYGDVALVARSPFYKTQPVDYADQDWFINAVFSIQTTASPEAILNRIQVVQQGAGREKTSIRFGPRILDLDILLFGDRVISTPNLVIPHPRMHKRRFVLQPLCDINPRMVHPVLLRTMGALLSHLGENEQQVTLIDD